MADLDRLRARARAAGEASLLAAALGPAPWLVAFVAAVAVLAPEGRLSMASLAAVLGSAIVLLGWRRPPLGRAAWQGLVVGAPVSVAALLARGARPVRRTGRAARCALPQASWASVATPAPAPDTSSGARALTAITAALAALVGCSTLGLGVGVAVAAATASAWAAASMIRPATR